MFDTQTTFSPTLRDIEAHWKLKQTQDIADNNLFGRLRVNTYWITFFIRVLNENLLTGPNVTYKILFILLSCTILNLLLHTRAAGHSYYKYKIFKHIQIMENGAFAP